MNLSTLISGDQVIADMKAADRWQAIPELVDLLVAKGRIKKKDRQSILEGLEDREKTMSTGIGFGVAIPHTSSDRVDNVVAAFGRSSEGIEFEALDEEPVRFVVLFVVPKDEFQMHLRTLAAIAKFLNDPSVRDELAAASTVSEILAAFNNRATPA